MFSWFKIFVLYILFKLSIIDFKNFWLFECNKEKISVSENRKTNWFEHLKIIKFVKNKSHFEIINENWRFFVISLMLLFLKSDKFFEIIDLSKSNIFLY